MTKRTVRFVGGPMDGKTIESGTDKNELVFPCKFVECKLGLGGMFLHIKYVRRDTDPQDTFYYWGPEYVVPEWKQSGFSEPYAGWDRPLGPFREDDVIAVPAYWLEDSE